MDVEGPTFIGQCKLVRALSLRALTDLALEVEAAAEPKAKLGVVAVMLGGRHGSMAMPTLMV